MVDCCRFFLERGRGFEEKLSPEHRSSREEKKRRVWYFLGNDNEREMSRILKCAVDVTRSVRY